MSGAFAQAPAIAPEGPAALAMRRVPRSSVCAKVRHRHRQVTHQLIELQQLLKKFRSGAYRDASSFDFTLDELAEAEKLAQHSDDRFDMLRLRGWYHFCRQELDPALAVQLEIFALRPTVEAIKNVGIIGRNLKKRTYAIDFLLQHEERFSENFEFYDGLAHSCGHFGDAANARRCGTRSLELKHARYGAKSEPPMPPMPPFRPDQKFNMIAFSLYGENARYVQPLLVSADIRPQLYPLWSMRIYADNSVSEDLANIFRSKGCEVVRVENSDLPGTFWRFFVADDENIDRFVVRDADSILNIRERVAVDAWIESRRHFHVMRDFYSHSELILAGLWGGVRGAIPQMRKLIAQWRSARRSVVYNQTTVDQIFLRETIWPIVHHSVLVHDSVFDFGEKSDFPPVGTLPPWKHVGQNDFIFFQKKGRG